MLDDINCNDAEDCLVGTQLDGAASLCLRIVTGTVVYSDGYLDVSVLTSVHQGSGYVSVTSGYWAKGSTVIEACFTTLLGVQVTNPNADGWIGAVELSEGGGAYLPLDCTGCTSTSSTARIVVDGNSDGSDQPRESFPLPSLDEIQSVVVRSRTCTYKITLPILLLNHHVCHTYCHECRGKALGVL